MNRLFLYAAAAAFLVSGCKAQAPSNAAPASQASVVATPAAPAAPALSPNTNCASDPKIQAPPAGSPAFDVAVTLSPAAQQTLSAAHETLCISAEFYGEVNDQGRKHHVGDEMDQVYFGGGEWRDEITAGSAHFAVPPADPATLQYVRDGKEQVLINVFTGRRSSQDNLISCDIFQDDVKLAEANDVHIACKLISETG